MIQVLTVCTGNVCQAPSCSDGVQNGNETDLNCGGGTCPDNLLDCVNCGENAPPLPPKPKPKPELVFKSIRDPHEKNI